MSLALRQPSIAAPPEDFIPVAEAARLTGLSVSRWQKVAAANQVKGLAFLHQSGKAKPTWHVSRSLHAALSPSLVVSSCVREKYPEHLVNRALLKKKWLDKWREACEAPRVAGVTDVVIAARIADEARHVEGTDFRISARSLQLWKSAHRDGGLEALIDRYGRSEPQVQAPGLAVPSSLRGSVASSLTRSPQAIDYFYECYRVRSQPSVKLCHELTRRESVKQNWAWPACASGTRRWLHQYDDLSLSFLTREGRDRWARRFLPHGEVDDSMVAPGEFFVCDHHQVDAWVTDGKTEFRPWLTAIQDLRSRSIVGWHLSASPHQDGILRALHRAFRDWSIPKTMRIDNGRDFASKLIVGLSSAERRTLRKELGSDWRDVCRRSESMQVCNDSRWLGITGELGIEVIFSIPYHPWSKGRCERFFGTFEGQCGKTFPTYCGRDTIRKPEFLDEIRRGYSDGQRRELKKKWGKDWRRYAALKRVDESKIPTMQMAEGWIRDWLALYHAEVHKFGVPSHIWKQAPSLRRAGENELLLLMQSRGTYKVTANGVRFKVGATEHGYGQGHAALRAHVGREVFVTCDPDDLSCCYAWTPGETRKFIGRLPSNQKLSAYTTAETERELIAEQMREQRTAMRGAKAGARRHLTLADRVREHQGKRRVELRATGTDEVVCDTGLQPAIEPVRTGFEGASMTTATARPATTVADDDFGVFQFPAPRVQDEREAESDEEFSIHDIPAEAEDEGNAGDLTLGIHDRPTEMDERGP